MLAFSVIRALILLSLAGAVSYPTSAQPLRSSLYPAGWTPGYSDEQGRFLHDFSYAGYHRGEAPLPLDSGGELFDVSADFGADLTGATDATPAIQAAIDAAEDSGLRGVVYFPAGTYRCDGTLTVSQDNITLRGAGADAAKLVFTQSAGFAFNAHISFQGAVSRGADLLLVEEAPNQSTVVSVADASSLAPGDDVALGWTISEAFVEEHGMTGTWNQFNGQWKPFFRREVVSVDLDATPNRVTLDIPTRYPAKLRDGASLRKESGYLSECVVEHLGLSNAVDYDVAWAQSQIHLLRFRDTKDCVIRKVKSQGNDLSTNNKGLHVQSGGFLVLDSKRVTVADCTLEKAQNRGSGGNGYLFEVRSSSDVLFRDCIGKSGRHNFIQNWDFGATGIVWLRCHSEGSQNVTRAGTLEFPLRADSEYHHSLATANLVDQCTIVDGWGAGNRGTESSGAGHSATQCVVWNVDGSGNGRIRSFNYGNGYVIGTTAATVYTASDISFGNLETGTAPNDFTEHLNNGTNLVPQSLYGDQLARRLGTLPDHSADSNNDGTLGLSELLRAVQLYNAGAFSCAEATEDGYAVGVGDDTCPQHALDYLAPDWIISLSELLRGIQLFSFGAYHACAESEDGYCAGVAL